MRLRFLLLGVPIAASLLIIFLLLPQTSPVAYVQGPNFPGRKHYKYLAVNDATKTGIECIYFVKSYEYNPSENLEGKPVVLAKIQRSLEKVAIPARQLFDIVVVVRATAPEGIAVLKKEYLKVRLGGSCGGGSFESFSADQDEYVFDSSGYGTSYGYLRANVVFDNAGDRYFLQPGELLVLEHLSLEVVK